MLSWPLQPDAAMVQFSDDLGSNSWSPLSVPGMVSNGLNTITVDGIADRGWYRLHYP